MIYYKNSSELYHHGILGQKWGVRRYQNPDGTLTDAGKKRYLTKGGKLTDEGRQIVSKARTKAENKLKEDVNSNYQKIWVDSYNKTVDKFNNEIDRLNKEQEQKYGKDFPDRPEYEKEIDDYFESLFSKEFSKTLSDFVVSNQNYKDVNNLIKTYDMSSWDSDTIRYTKDMADIVKK